MWAVNSSHHRQFMINLHKCLYHSCTLKWQVSQIIQVYLRAAFYAHRPTTCTRQQQGSKWKRVHQWDEHWLSPLDTCVNLPASLETGKAPLLFQSRRRVLWQELGWCDLIHSAQSLGPVLCQAGPPGAQMRDSNSSSTWNNQWEITLVYWFSNKEKNMPVYILSKKR